MTNITDVARRAGVSTMTVSRVINNTGQVGEETRRRVEAAVAELGYVPNSLARSLRIKRTKTLALVLTDITNSFFTTVARGVEDTASRQGFNVFFCNTDESAAEQATYLQALVERQVDGVLLVPAGGSGGGVGFLQGHGVPVVLIDRIIPGYQMDVVRGDSVQGSYVLTRLLLDLGHRTIAILAGPAGVSTAGERVRGYRMALAEAGIDPDASPNLIINGNYSQAGGYEMAQAALQAYPRPTALFACNNFIAVGAYHALRSMGLRVPEDVALVGFDDLATSVAIEPFLTAAAQPAYEMGRRATELLLARLAGSGPADCQDVILPVQIIVRRSSGLPIAPGGTIRPGADPVVTQNT
jgi:LacI family transcriptional regulator